MKISIICPLYNAEKYIEKLHESILKQNLDEDDYVNIFYALTDSQDNTEKYLKDKNIKYKKIKKEEFSHSLTREKMAYEFGQDIIVFISQDIIVKDENWLKNLIYPIKEGIAEATFSRQISKYNNIEKYTREYNYKEESRVVSKNDLEKLGLYTFFYSDASSAINAKIYKELKAYDGKKLLINEDMYLAHKIIENGYRIKYCSDSIVFHSHKFRVKELFKRYFDTGVFFKENNQFKKYSGNSNGINMVKYITKRALEEKNYKCLINIIPDFGSRFLGSNLGKKYDKLNKKLILKCTLNKNYWDL
ncbi:glycosyltransferase [Clostridium thermobutyricum]|uniref:glycosyltransferase n=1 Tax=Clostridium thermobutyricum TaxID=29372 RepID=UPI003F523FC7